MKNHTSSESSSSSCAFGCINDSSKLFMKFGLFVVLKFAQICSKFFLFFFTKTQKTHRCTFATDAGRRLRTTRTSLDVDISSVRLPFSSILLFTTLTKVFLFLVSRFVVVLSASFSLSLSLLLTHILLLNLDAFYSRTNNR